MSSETYSGTDEEGRTPFWQTLNTNDVKRLSWAQEIEDTISVVDEPIQEFLSVFVPGLGPSEQPSNDVLKDKFKAVDTKGEEVANHPKLMGALRNLVKGFDAETRPTFADGRRCEVPFPFEAWDHDQHYAMPDIIMSHPGNGDNQWARTWSGISTVFEVKPDDPVDEDSATIRTDALSTYGLIQISKSARNLLHTHGLLYAYVVGIYADKARIYRFDHAAGVVSRAIDLKSDPSPLYDFLWRFCHYKHGGQLEPVPGIFLGMDPTISVASEADCNKVDELLQTSSPPRKPLTKHERQSCRWVTVVTEYNLDGSAKATKRYILYRLRFLHSRLFSRATRVWEAYEAETWEWRAVKDAWRQLARDREDVLYRRLYDQLLARDDLKQLVEECKRFGLSPDTGDGTRSDSAPLSTAGLNGEDIRPAVDDTQLYGLPDVMAGDDLGAREARRLFDSKCSEQPTSTSSPSEADLDSLALGETGRPPVYSVYHRTICFWSLARTVARFYERSHMRLVMKTVGRPLSSFKSTKELVTAIRDAIIGHMLAFKAGLIHRDLSDGNVLIHDGGLFTGFLLDLDYAFDWMEALRLSERPVDEAAWETYVAEYNAKVAHIGRFLPREQTMPPLIAVRPTQPSQAAVSRAKRMQREERTGTLFFMAIEVLKTYVAHDICHDLESAIWLLLCMVLRHTLQIDFNKRVYNGLDRYALYLQHFASTNEMDSSRAKGAFGNDAFHWEVKDNKRLTDLIHDLRRLVHLQNRDSQFYTQSPITYESILTALNRSLAMPDWPENDAALPFTLPVNDKGSSGSDSRKHSLEEEDENEDDAADEAGRRRGKKIKLSPLRNTFGPK
ncbi:hypothetical protein C8Q72DRAFT_911174 [Fomitopsis betulina]|nr:hypothetical protein C8Q72DRAFT_911174 [Fomitopsis betulina]